MRRLTQFTFAFLAVAALPACSPVRAVEDADSQPRVVVHLLEYLASDYGGAVSERGEVKSAGEYKEQREFARSVQEISHQVPAVAGDAAVAERISALRSAIDHRATPERVATLAHSVKADVIRLTGLAQTPAQWPSLERGRTLFLQNCASCHGEQGRGDGVAGTALQPKPANFHSASVASAIFPLRAFNSIRLGVSGTAMAAWPQLSDGDTWDLAFYVTSLHHEGAPTGAKVESSDLLAASTRTDAQLLASLRGSDSQKREKLVALRLHSGDGGPTAGGPGDGMGAETLGIARRNLNEAEQAYAADNYPLARDKAVLAYLEGVEPVEPKLRGLDPDLLARVESVMADLRGAISARKPMPELKNKLAAARAVLDETQTRVAPQVSSPLAVFLLSAGILLREGFEAVLMLVALLAVIRASGSRRAERFVHGGWIGALAVALGLWFASGRLMLVSGATRETLEGYTALGAVVILLYVGFWLHRRTEISRWKSFIEDQVRAKLSGGKLWALATIAFFAVFREALETVLFLRAISLEGGGSGEIAMQIGVIAALAATIGLAWLLLRSSAKLPIRKIFAGSSMLMIALAVILTGKGVHALQGTGTLSITYWPSATIVRVLRSDLLGFYPTWESFAAQLLVLSVALLMWKWNSTPHAPAPRSARAVG